jgi:FkbM family methyltransferase
VWTVGRQDLSGIPGHDGSRSVARWAIQRGAEDLRFEMELDPADFTEKAILDYYGARSFYEPDVSMLLIQVLRAGDVVFDVGANCGYFSVLAGALVGRGGQVVALEAAPACIERLKVNVARNAFHHLDIVAKAASNRVGETVFHLNRDNSGGNALWDPGLWPDNEKSRGRPESITVPATTLDAEWRGRGLAVPKLIKIDTEGAEQMVLEGARELLSARVPFVVAELHEFGLEKLGASQASLRALMHGFGYSTFTLYFSGAMPKFIPGSSQIRCPFFINLLFSTPETIAEYWPVATVDPRSPT